MAVRFYNTLTRSVEKFVPREPGKIGMYACGPTVYNRAHIGNFRTFLFADLVCRYLRYRGYQVFLVMNITDIDDRTIKGAIQEGISLREYTERYTQMFFEDRDRLGILPADLYPRATEHISEMVEIVEKLIEKGHAYKADSSWFYKVESFPKYGELARLDQSSLRVGERVATDNYEKEDVRDFALWKGWEPEDDGVFWETPLGKGRPGWHLECSAMSLKYLGEDFDIHAGGVDLIFPHHQNEVAQTEGATGKRLARYWLHSEHLMIERDKMSKSLGNFFTLQDLLDQGWSAREVRFVLLGAHYRQQLNFTFASPEAARAALERVDACVRNLQFSVGGGGLDEAKQVIGEHETAFKEAMDDDLNYPNAVASIFNMIRDINTLCAQGKIGQAEANEVLAALNRLNSVVGYLEPGQKVMEEDEKIDRMVRARDGARRQKQWAEADRLRDELASRDIILEDRAGGTVWRRK